MPTKKRATSKSPGPYIKSVYPVSNRQEPKTITRATAGQVLRIEGRNFGSKSHRVRVLFDEYEVEPYPVPFSETSLIVTTPLPVKKTDTISLTVNKHRSNNKSFRLSRPSRPRGAPGDQTKALFSSVDRFATLTAASARWLAPATEFEKQLRQAADQIDGLRRVNQRNIETLMQWCNVQERARKGKFPLEAIQTIRRMDEQIHLGKLVQTSDRLTTNTFGPTSSLARSVGKDHDAAQLLMSQSSILDDVASSLGQGVTSLAGLLGFILHEATKVIEAFEDVGLMESTSASLDGGASAGGELTGGVDVSFSPAYGLSAVAKLVDTIAQILIKVGEAGDSLAVNIKLDGIVTDVAKLEQKADTQGTVLTRIEIQSNQQSETLGRLETASQQQEAKLDVLQDSANQQTGLLNTLNTNIDTLEVKADRQAEKLDQLEAKGDRQEEKLDQLEAKADRHEEKLDVLEAKADRQEQKLDVLESKADRQEQKLDALEGKADRQEQKLDVLDGKADRQEQKLDLLEGKADRQEQKLDRLEGKADRQELKLDRQESKLDIIEEKLDREEAKLDRLSLPTPAEGSVASQLDDSDGITAAVTTTGAADNEVYLKALIDSTSAELDVESSWSDWVSFGRPANSGGILEVSIDLHYQHDSDTRLNALLSARDRMGNIYHRGFEARNHGELLDPDQWTTWQKFLAQPT